MYKLIIIDDEMLIRNGLTGYLDWQALNVEIAAVCANGQEGLEAIRAHEPDMVLTDIAMPVLDGIGLIRQARREGFGGQFIFISSYSEFSYAQEAVKYSAFDYLLKPLEASALEECICRCIQRIDQLSQAAAWPWDRDMACELMRGALFGVSQGHEALFSFLKRQGQYYPQPSLGIWADQEGPALRHTPDMLACALSKNISVCLFAGEKQRAQAMNTYPLHNGLLIPCGDDIHSALCHGLIRLWLKDHPMPAQTPGTPEAKPVSGIRPMIPVVDGHTYRLNVCSVAGELLCQPSLTLMAAVNHCQGFLRSLCHGLEKSLDISALRSGSFEETMVSLGQASHTYELMDRLMAAGGIILKWLDYQPNVTPYTRKAIRVIQSQYGENISLGSVAQSLGISKSHLSTTFKADTGYSFSDYLFEYRMKTAKQLIKEGQKKMYEIGQLVGYPDIAQFSKRFKQYYAVSPRDMQRMVQREL